MPVELQESVAELLRRSREASWRSFGKRITFYLPGMISLDGKSGRYPAVSITGKRCQLNCAHCGATILEPMVFAETSSELVRKCLELEAAGSLGCLITGGSLRDGRLPWGPFVEAIRQVKERTRLDISIHTGLIDYETARDLKAAGVDHAMIDLVGDDRTLLEVCHLDCGVGAVERSLEALARAGLALVPHVVVGLHYGEVRGEPRALEMAARYDPETLVIVVLMPLRNTPMQEVEPPPLDEVARILALARQLMPATPISLGCARPRGRYGYAVEELAIDSGVNRVALHSERAIGRARAYGLEIAFADTCCSVNSEQRMVNGE